MGGAPSSLGRARADDEPDRDGYSVPSAQSHLSVEQIRDMIARGIRPDLSLLPFQMPRMEVDGIPPPPIETNARRIRNEVNLCKSTIQLVPSEPPSRFYIAFNFDAFVPCTASVYFAAVEDGEGGQLRLPSLILGVQRSPSVGRFGPGLDQTFQTEEAFDLSVLPASSLMYIPYSKSYPLAIRLTVEDANSSKGSFVKSQTSYCTFVKQGNSYVVKVMKQTVDVGGRFFEIEEIYGMESADCVICMSAPRNTALLPCKHCVVCSQCADILRVQTAKCPICRSAVFKLLKIGPS